MAAAAEKEVDTSRPSHVPNQAENQPLDESECLHELCKQDLMILVAGVITWMLEYSAHLTKKSTETYVNSWLQALTTSEKISNIAFYNTWVKCLNEISSMPHEEFIAYLDKIFTDLNKTSQNTSNNPVRIEIARKFLPSLKALHQYFKSDLGDDAKDQVNTILQQLILAIAALVHSTSDYPLEHQIYDPNISTHQSELLIPRCPDNSFTNTCFSYILYAMNLNAVTKNVEVNGSRATCNFDARFYAAVTNFANAAFNTVYMSKLLARTDKKTVQPYVPPHRRLASPTSPDDATTPPSTSPNATPPPAAICGMRGMGMGMAGIFSSNNAPNPNLVPKKP